jgi:hypothetical protein
MSAAKKLVRRLISWLGPDYVPEAYMEGLMTAKARKHRICINHWNDPEWLKEWYRGYDEYCEANDPRDYDS